MGKILFENYRIKYIPEALLNKLIIHSMQEYQSDEAYYFVEDVQEVVDMINRILGRDDEIEQKNCKQNTI